MTNLHELLPNTNQQISEYFGVLTKIYLGDCLMSKGVILVGYFQQFGIFLGYGQNLYFRCSVLSDMFDFWVTE